MMAYNVISFGLIMILVRLAQGEQLRLFLFAFMEKLEVKNC